MKSKNVAFFLNFFLPGAGFGYLKRWKLAAINFGIAIGIGAVLGVVMPESFWDGIGSYLAIAIGGGSGGWAMHVAEEMNAEAEAEANRPATLDEVAEQARLP